MHLQTCPKWDNCNAALCPLGWTDGKAGQHLPGEKICPLALELMKEGGAERVRTIVPEEVASQIEWVLPAITAAYPGTIGSKLTQASRTGSRIELGRDRIKAARAARAVLANAD